MDRVGAGVRSAGPVLIPRSVHTSNESGRNRHGDRVLSTQAWRTKDARRRDRVQTGCKQSGCATYTQSVARRSIPRANEFIVRRQIAQRFEVRLGMNVQYWYDALPNRFAEEGYRSISVSQNSRDPRAMVRWPTVKEPPTYVRERAVSHEGCGAVPAPRCQRP